MPELMSGITRRRVALAIAVCLIGGASLAISAKSSATTRAASRRTSAVVSGAAQGSSTLNAPRVSGSCPKGETCAQLPATGGRYDLTLGTQDSYGFTAQEPPPAGGPSVWQRLQALHIGAWRSLSQYQYNDEYTTDVSPESYYVDFGSGVDHLSAWDFRTLDKELSEAPDRTPKEVDEQLPLPLWTCTHGSWTNPTTGCRLSGSPVGALTDQTYRAAASYYANLVRYFERGVLASGAGKATRYTADGLTDTARDFAGDRGDCVTATVRDANGFPDWVTGTIRSVLGRHHDTIALRGSWSTADSYDSEAGISVPRSTPAAGAAFNLASCTPPGGLSGPTHADPWPRPPSVGDVKYFEIGNEVDLSNSNLYFSNPALSAPSGIRLTGVNVAHGSLKPGQLYAYRIASVGAQASGTYCSHAASDNVCGGPSLPSGTESIRLPAGDDAVRVSWNTPNFGGLQPYAYLVYGRGLTSHLGLAAVGRLTSGCPSACAWTDTGDVTPSGAPASVNESAGGQLITPGVYYQEWNVIAPAMRKVDRAIRLNGPVEANSSGYGEPSVDTGCLTTHGIDSSCADGRPGWSIALDYIPTLLTYGEPRPSVVTFHGYGTSTSDTPEAPTFSGISSYEIANYDKTDRRLIDRDHIPVWIDEANVDANNTGNASTGDDFRSMTQMGSAWLADDVVRWASTDSNVRHIVDWSSNSNDTSWELFGRSDLRGDTSCVPQPACQDIRTDEPDLEYWSIYEINHILGRGGRLVRVTGVPAGFDALAVETSPTTVTVLLVNRETGADNGRGESGDVNLRLAGATVTHTSRVAINGSTSMADGPSIENLGAASSVPIAAQGYEVDLITFRISRSARG